MTRLAASSRAGVEAAWLEASGINRGADRAVDPRQARRLLEEMDGASTLRRRAERCRVWSRRVALRTAQRPSRALARTGR